MLDFGTFCTNCGSDVASGDDKRWVFKCDVSVAWDSFQFLIHVAKLFYFILQLTFYLGAFLLQLYFCSCLCLFLNRCSNVFKTTKPLWQENIDFIYPHQI